MDVFNCWVFILINITLVTIIFNQTIYSLVPIFSTVFLVEPLGVSALVNYFLVRGGKRIILSQSILSTLTRQYGPRHRKQRLNNLRNPLSNNSCLLLGVRIKTKLTYASKGS